MKIDDYSFYKKNALTRHNMSRELLKHRKELDESKKNIINFVVPVFSAVVSLSIVFYTQEFNFRFITNVAFVIFSFAALYFLTRGFIYFVEKVRVFINDHFLNIGSTKNVSDEKLDDFKNNFNYDVVNQIYFSYCLLTNNEEVDILLKRYYYIESLFYVEKSLGLMKSVYELDIKKEIEENNFIQKYRIEIVFNILNEILKKIKSAKYDILNNDLINAVESYNNLVETLNEKGEFELNKLLI